MGEDPLSLALRALARKERSVAEMGRWLHGRGVGDAEAAEVIDQLIATGGLDDAAFAARFTADKRELAGWGSERIRATLLQRGVDPADVEAAVGDDDGELERAEALLRARGHDLDDDRGRGRALAALVRMGYESDLAYEAVRRAERLR